MRELQKPNIRVSYFSYIGAMLRSGLLVWGLPDVEQSPLLGVAIVAFNTTPRLCRLMMAPPTQDREHLLESIDTSLRMGWGYVEARGQDTDTLQCDRQLGKSYSSHEQGTTN